LSPFNTKHPREMAAIARACAPSGVVRGGMYPRGKNVQRLHGNRSHRLLIISSTVSEDDRARAKERLLSLCASLPGVGVYASDEQRQAAVAAAEALEKYDSPFDKPASTDAVNGALDGTWALEFTTTKESSAGKIGPFLGTVTQEVKVSEDLYTNNVRFGPLSLTLGANWNVLDDQNWRVNFVDIVVKLFGLELKRIAFPPERGGFWRMTYTDNDLRVLWTLPGESGQFDKDGKKGSIDGRQASVFVLKKIETIHV